MHVRPDDARDLFELKLIEIVQDNNRAHERREFVESAIQLRVALTVRDELRGIARVNFLRQDPFVRQANPSQEAAVPPHMLNPDAITNRVEKGIELTFAAKAGQTAVNPEERLLNEIVELRVRAREPPHVARDERQHFAIVQSPRWRLRVRGRLKGEDAAGLREGMHGT